MQSREGNARRVAEAFWLTKPCALSAFARKLSSFQAKAQRELSHKEMGFLFWLKVPHTSKALDIGFRSGQFYFPNEHWYTQLWLNTGKNIAQNHPHLSHKDYFYEL